MLALYSRPETAGTIIHCALEMAGTPHRIIRVTKASDASVSPSDYLTLNPTGTVPTLVDGDLVLYETVAILEHLIETVPGLGPRTGEPHRPELHFWLGWLANNPMAAFYRWFKADQMIAADAVSALRAGAVTSLRSQGEWLERELLDRHWLVGAAPTAADIYLQCLQSWAEEIDDLRFGGDVVAEHSARTRNLPGVAAALAQESASA
ncbi:MAG: glutathione S-transferase family protein [Solirubrobacteraceae bacterium]